MDWIIGRGPPLVTTWLSPSCASVAARVCEAAHTPRLTTHDSRLTTSPPRHVRQPIRTTLAHRAHVVSTQRRSALGVRLSRGSQAIFVDGHPQAGPVP